MTATTSRTQQQGDRLAGPRTTAFRWEALSLKDAPLGRLDGVTGGSIDWSNQRTIRATGSLDWAGVSVPDWLSLRVQPWITLTFPDGTGVEWPLGVFIPATPDTEWGNGVASASVDLYDKLQVLTDDVIGPAYGVAAGANVTAAVRSLITGTGETKVAITDSPETLRSPMVWEPGTSRLEIINDLLKAINYWALDVDGFGYYRAAPYIRPQDRGIVRDFSEGPERIYAPKFSHSRDTFGTPNVVTLITRGEGYIEGLVSSARNTDPTDPLSIPRRGREVEVVEEGVEATSQKILDDMAKRRLVDLSQVSSAVQIEHAPIPLGLNDRVVFGNDLSGLTLSAVVQSMSLDLSDPGALMRSRLVAVAS